MPGNRTWPQLAGNIFLFLVCAGAAASVCAAKPKGIREETIPPFEVVDERGSHLVQHAGHYETPKIEWQLEPRVPAAEAAFADPYVPAHVLVATGSGLVETRDHGQFWQADAAASTGRIGPISSVCFRHDTCDRYYVGSKTRGLWQTVDGGRTFQQLASKASGLASDSVLAAYMEPGDELCRTLLVIHGEDAPGVSRSVDGGKTWQVLYPDYHVLRVVFYRDSLRRLLVAASRQHADIRNVYCMPSLQEPWQTLISDTVCTGSAQAISRQGTVYLSTSDKGIFKISDAGAIVKNVGLLNDQEWASLGSTWGASTDAEFLYAYDPKKFGMVLFTPNQLDPADPLQGQPAPPPPARPYSVQSHGLFTGPLVAEGAHIQANANGTVFYAVANKSLYVGRQMAGSIMVREVSVEPPFQELKPEVLKEAFHKLDDALDAFSAEPNIVQAAGQLQSCLQGQSVALALQRITVTAKVEYREGHPPKSVSVDLRCVDVPNRRPLLDVGQRSKESLGEGVYANTFFFDTRRTGMMGLSVSAVADDGSLAGAVGIMGIQQERLASVPFWPGWWFTPERETGSVKGGIFNIEGRPQGRIGNRTRNRAPGSEPQHRISILKADPWSVRIEGPEAPLDLSRFYAISFLLRADREVADDLAISLRDAPTYALPTTTSPVFMIKEGYIRSGKIATTLQRVTIPVSRLIKNSPDFQPNLTHWVIFSGKSSGAADLFISRIRCYPSPESLPADEEDEL